LFPGNIYLCCMYRPKENIRNIHLDSIFLILIFFFGLAIFQNTDYNKPAPKGKPVSDQIFVLQDNATLSTGICFNLVQKSWISNKDNFRLLTFDQTKFLDNKKVNRLICLLDQVRRKSPGFLILLTRYHLFPQEKSEIPVLS